MFYRVHGVVGAVLFDFNPLRSSSILTRSRQPSIDGTCTHDYRKPRVRFRQRNVRELLREIEQRKHLESSVGPSKKQKKLGPKRQEESLAVRGTEQRKRHGHETVAWRKRHGHETVAWRKRHDCRTAASCEQRIKAARRAQEANEQKSARRKLRQEIRGEVLAHINTFKTEDDSSRAFSIATKVERHDFKVEEDEDGGSSKQEEIEEDGSTGDEEDYEIVGGEHDENSSNPGSSERDGDESSGSSASGEEDLGVNLKQDRKGLTLGDATPSQTEVRDVRVVVREVFALETTTASDVGGRCFLRELQRMDLDTASIVKYRITDTLALATFFFRSSVILTVVILVFALRARSLLFLLVLFAGVRFTARSFANGLSGDRLEDRPHRTTKNRHMDLGHTQMLKRLHQKSTISTSSSTQHLLALSNATRLHELAIHQPISSVQLANSELKPACKPSIVTRRQPAQGLRLPHGTITVSSAVLGYTTTSTPLCLVPARSIINIRIPINHLLHHNRDYQFFPDEPNAKHGLRFFDNLTDANTVAMRVQNQSQRSSRTSEVSTKAKFTKWT
ncbi:uncharacterized protein MYCGRDRAFT_97935 [Zymoseptoria tritici IPO323]|uniref:Uncharacterized protein n=1 Tax=Zymoseptoria tritici (strain CBS 115943 / IPO323) TaxID=336722 RepID=F9XRU2_ZYMTI|nr:uncharacterized protein MYCGRDRAFT_97935 [Zymoseptoria tritici IPO323]EGP81974.1 hypothetical protein MYCGRDRAFT_97935 [Zymoseptoria tritici IPO323]